ncbi:MAG: hypothetical protein NTX00_02030 [Candidatus Parcubacteria bacterium]|nr:hypothetical protein [Candidatus Parcubacteria bacterium]
MPKTVVVIVQEMDEEDATVKYRDDPTLEIKIARLPFERFGSIPSLTGIHPTDWVMVLLKNP